MRSATQITAQARACISKDAPPRISVAALLELARWCQQHPSSPQGGEPCLSTAVPVRPPAPRGTNAAADPTLGVVSGRPTSTALPSAERTGGTLPPVRGAEGGD